MVSPIQTGCDLLDSKSSIQFQREASRQAQQFQVSNQVPRNDCVKCKTKSLQIALILNCIAVASGLLYPVVVILNMLFSYFS